MQEANTSSTARTFCNCKESKGAVFVKRGGSQAAGYCMSSQHRDGVSLKCAKYPSSNQKAIKLDTQDHGHKCKSDSGFGKNSCTSLDPPVLQSKWKLARTWCFAVESACVFQLDCCQSLVPGEELLTEAEGLACLKDWGTLWREFCLLCQWPYTEEKEFSLYLKKQLFQDSNILTILRKGRADMEGLFSLLGVGDSFINIFLFCLLLYCSLCSCWSPIFLSKLTISSKISKVPPLKMPGSIPWNWLHVKRSCWLRRR